MSTSLPLRLNCPLYSHPPIPFTLNYIPPNSFHPTTRAVKFRNNAHRDQTRLTLL